MRVRQRVTILLTTIAVLAVTLEAVVWMAANPLPSYWDEAGYYASTVHFTRLVRHFGLSRFGTAWNFDPFRPPINVPLRAYASATAVADSTVSSRTTPMICSAQTRDMSSLRDMGKG